MRYEDSAYSDEEVREAYRARGYPTFSRCIAEGTTKGLTLTQIAEELGLNPPRFWAYYSVWAKRYLKPLRLGPESDDSE